MSNLAKPLPKESKQRYETQPNISGTQSRWCTVGLNHRFMGLHTDSCHLCQTCSKLKSMERERAAHQPGEPGGARRRLLRPCLNLLPHVGPGWYPKVSLAAMLDLGVCRWDHIVSGISARSHVGAATLRRALERMDEAWPEEHMAKLSVNAMIGLWSTEVVYSVRSSSSELDGAGADFSQALCGTSSTPGG